MKTRALVLLLALNCSSTAFGCPSPTVPVIDFEDRYEHIFVGVVVGVSLTRGGYVVDQEISDAIGVESGKWLTDSGPGYEVRVVATKTFKGTAPSDQWLQIRPGCHTEAPSLLENGIFAITDGGDLIAGYQHQTEFFNFNDLLRDLQSRFSGAR